MSRAWLFGIAVTLVVCAVLTLFAPSALAGPPLLCWPFDIGSARSLPFVGDNWRAADPSYNIEHLADDTLALLQPNTPVIVRMETLRRATIYAMKNRDIAARLLERMEARVRDAESRGKPDAPALFDLGFLLEAFKQADMVSRSSGPARDRDGRALIEQAIRLRGSDAEMEFAAALASAESSEHSSQRRLHVQKAIAGANEGSLLAKNLVTHAHLLQVRGNSLGELRAQLQLKNQ